ncbi:MarR family winged helix-turn-helix transcriptional regulator [Brachybacterium sp. GCM10030267]|uniref:MarR family winged helix-turn-helix transcriptional regulator n=1 Tax=unclassified Brachybacterium TaxID=2623841 RepID=UPI00362453F1
MAEDRQISPRELGVYFALMESATLLRYQVEQQLKVDAGLGYVQFEMLATLVDAGGEMTMTALADQLVHSRSGLTHQAGLLEKSGLIARSPHPRDQRSTLVQITEAGRDAVATVMPGHIAIARELFLDELSPEELEALDAVLPRVREHMRASTEARSKRSR